MLLLGLELIYALQVICYGPRASQSQSSYFVSASGKTIVLFAQRCIGCLYWNRTSNTSSLKVHLLIFPSHPNLWGFFKTTNTHQCESFAWYFFGWKWLVSDNFPRCIGSKGSL